MLTIIKDMLGKPRYEPRRPLPIKRKRERASLDSARSSVNAMSRYLGIQPENIGDLSFNIMIKNCRRCQNRAECRLWIMDIEKAATCPSFCLNATRFITLKSREQEGQL